MMRAGQSTACISTLFVLRHVDVALLLGLIILVPYFPDNTSWRFFYLCFSPVMVPFSLIQFRLEITMLVKILDAPEELVLTLKEITGAQTGSKAFLEAARLMLRLDEITDKQARELAVLRAELKQHRTLLQMIQEQSQALSELSAKDPKTIESDTDEGYAWWDPEETAVGQ